MLTCQNGHVPGVTINIVLKYEVEIPFFLCNKLYNL